jgi:acyl-CoA reductase-like NAD-dependent aldehyde dehydrogenase
VNPGSQLAQTEIFGPVLGVLHAKDIAEAGA